jgi:hypothetical protein
MDEPTDPLARQLAVTALTTEHFNLQSARMGTITEANGRATLYLGTLSSSVIAIAFVGQANQLGDAFYLFALTLLPPVFLLGGVQLPAAGADLDRGPLAAGGTGPGGGGDRRGGGAGIGDPLRHLPGLPLPARGGRGPGPL